jgi:hypothetical protein
MIEIRYSDPYNLDISGIPDDLQFVRQEVMRIIQSDIPQLTIEANINIDPEPYDFALARLVIVKSNCPTIVELKNDNEIHIEGSISCLDAFASFFDFGLSEVSGYHHHYEYYEGSEWISSTSIPLVIRVK